MPYFASTKTFLVTRKWYVLAGILALAAIGFFVFGGGNGAEQEPEAGLRQVQMLAVADYGKGALGVAVPTANGNSYVVRSEIGGKVTRAAKNGPVAQGALVAQLENSAQRAALTQAEGAYEAAVAASGGNVTSQQSANQAGVRAWTSATVSAAETVRTSVDIYYSDVRGTQGAAGFRLEAFGGAAELNAARTAVEAIFDRWEGAVVTEGNVTNSLDSLSSDLVTVGTLVDRIAALVPRQDISEAYSESDRSSDAENLATARASITTLQQSVDSARTAITNASKTGDASAQAQVKQALGVLEAARVAYGKTTVRAPFAGTLVAVNVKTGDILSAGGDVAIIIPREGVETERRFSLPLSSVKYTPAGAFVFIVKEGILESRKVETGLVTADSISVTGLNGDEYIVRDVRGLKAGEPVTVIE